jgi:hypothetical protein
MMHYFKRSLILVLSSAAFVLVIAGICSLVVYVPTGFAWEMVVIVALSSLAACPLLTTLVLLKTGRGPLRLFDLIACGIISLLAVGLLNGALSFFTYQLSGRHISHAAWRMLWLDSLGWLIGLFTLFRFVSGLPEAK